MITRLHFRRLLISTILVAGIGQVLNGQTIPEAINYQAIARNLEGEPLKNADLKIRISIMTSEPKMAYVETHDVTTNELGIFDLAIGNGVVELGDMKSIEWGSHRYFVQIEMASGNSPYQIIGNSELLSVPYAFYALEAANATTSAGGSDTTWKKKDNSIYYNSGNVGIGTENPEANLSVVQTIEIIGKNDQSSIKLTTESPNISDISLQGSDGIPRASLFVLNRAGNLIMLNKELVQTFYSGSFASGTGFMTVYGANGNRNIIASSLSGSANNGWLGVGDENGDPRAQIYVGSDGDGNILLRNIDDNVSMRSAAFNSGSGYLETYGDNGSDNVSLTSLKANGNNGYVAVSDSKSEVKAALYINSDNEGSLLLDNSGDNTAVFATSLSSGQGYLSTIGSNGNDNVRLTNLSSNSNRGYVGVYDASETAQAGIYVDGTGRGIVFGDTKNFVMDHPENPENEIVYASIEGPEAAAFCRGTAKLIDGNAVVILPEHFQYVASGKNLTVLLTPLSASSKGMAITAKSLISFEVQELWEGKGNYAFDWEVKDVRKGYEDYKVIRQKQFLSSDKSEQPKTLNARTSDPIVPKAGLPDLSTTPREIKQK